jgi:hypothetical protein
LVDASKRSFESEKSALGATYPANTKNGCKLSAVDDAKTGGQEYGEFVCEASLDLDN